MNLDLYGVIMAVLIALVAGLTAGIGYGLICYLLSLIWIELMRIRLKC